MTIAPIKNEASSVFAELPPARFQSFFSIRYWLAFNILQIQALSRKKLLDHG